MLWRGRIALRKSTRYPPEGVDLGTTRLVVTPGEARSLVRDHPKRWSAAFIEAPGTPLLDHPEAKVRLHPTVGAAEDELRARRDGLLKDGYKVTFGTLGKGLMVFRRDGDERAIAVDKPARRRASGGNQLSL